MEKNNEKILWTKKEVAQKFQVSTKTISRLIAQGQLPFIQIGSSIRIQKTDVFAFVERQKQYNLGCVETMCASEGEKPCSVFKRSDGRSENYYFHVQGPSGKATKRSTGTRDKRLAETIRAKYLLERSQEQVFGRQPDRSFKELIVIYLESSQRKRGFRDCSMRVNRFFKPLVRRWLATSTQVQLKITSRSDPERLAMEPLTESWEPCLPLLITPLPSVVGRW